MSTPSEMFEIDIAGGLVKAKHPFIMFMIVAHCEVSNGGLCIPNPSLTHLPSPTRSSFLSLSLSLHLCALLISSQCVYALVVSSGGYCFKL